MVSTVAGREAALATCLAALDAQTRRPDEVVVVEGMPSVVSAVREGFRRADGDWIAFVDDDAAPDTRWLETLSAHFADATVGAVGGRIENVVGGRPQALPFVDGHVAHLSWYGRSVEQLDRVPERRLVRDVAFLRGSNMCFRRQAISDVDARLDVGMAPGYETALCLDVRRQGWVVRFDSDALVRHYPAPRPDALSRNDAVRHRAEYSEVVTYTLLRYLSWPRRVAFLVYFFVIGQSASPGLVAGPLFFFRSTTRAAFAAAWRGKIRGFIAACTA